MKRVCVPAKIYKLRNFSSFSLLEKLINLFHILLNVTLFKQAKLHTYYSKVCKLEPMINFVNYEWVFFSIKPRQSWYFVSKRQLFSKKIQVAFQSIFAIQIKQKTTIWHSWGSKCCQMFYRDRKKSLLNIPLTFQL